jgi:glycerophosphoryl diester phosphodiesterase
MRSSLTLLALALAGCGFMDAPGTPLVEAHRGGAGYFPENSRTALLSAIDKGYGGIEFDIALTKDLIPVISHDPWLNEHCTRADGSALPAERVYIKDLTLDELHAGYRCGGVPDATTPDAVVKSDTHMTFEELLTALPRAPQMLVHIDVKYEPGMSQGADEFATRILASWRAAALSNPVYVTANLPEALKAFKAQAPEIETSLVWPRFPAGSSSVPIALGSELKNMFGTDELVKIARDASADGLCIAYQVADRRSIETAKAEGLKIQIWTLNSKSLLGSYCSWPIDSVITDVPELSPCK